MKFYAVVFGNWHGIDPDDVVDMFYNEEDAEKDCGRRNDNCDSDEWFEVQEWDEEMVKKFWGDYPIS